MCALLGLNLEDGESEFVAILPPFEVDQENAAGQVAADILEARLGIRHLHLPRVVEGVAGDEWKAEG